MSKRDFKLLIEDILEAINKISSYIADKSFDEFINDNKTIDAVVRNLEIIGEAANHIPSRVKERAKHIKWHRIIGLRNRVIHEYFGVDLNIIWKIISEDLQNLENQLKRLKEKDL